MTESVSSTNSITLQALSDLKAFRSYRKAANNSDKVDNSDEQNADNRRASVSRKALSEIRSRRSQTENRSETQLSEQNIRNMLNSENKSVFMSEENMPADRPSPFLSEDMMGVNRKSVFMSEENMPADRPSPFLSEDMMGANRKSAFMTQENVSADRPSPFLSDEVMTQDRSKQFYSPEVNNGEQAANNTKKQGFKSVYAITAELRNNAMSATMTPFDIAREYGIPLRQAEDIYMTLNADKNGVVKEQKLPENSTVSYRV